MNLFSWPKFDEGCWNYHMIPVHSRAVSGLPSGAKENGKIVLDYFGVLSTIMLLIWILFCFSWKIDTTSLLREYVNGAAHFAQMFKIFASIMANFSALGMRLLWLKITPTYWNMKDNDVRQEKYSSVISGRTEEKIVWTVNKDERCVTFYVWISVLVFSMNDCYCYALWGREHIEIGNIGKA